jgi:hypothetical protein
MFEEGVYPRVRLTSDALDALTLSLRLQPLDALA